YYSGAYVAAGGHAKLVEGTRLGDSLLAVGRSFFNLVCPVAVSPSYDPGSVRNLIGVLLLPPFLFALYRVAGRRPLGWVLFGALPLATVTARMTNIFVSDTYLLLPAVGLGGAMVEALPAKKGRALTLSALLLEALFTLG